jgi:hypothetical protein
VRVPLDLDRAQKLTGFLPSNLENPPAERNTLEKI